MKVHSVTPSELYTELKNELASGNAADGSRKKIIMKTSVGDGYVKSWFEVVVPNATWGFNTLVEAVESYNEY